MLTCASTRGVCPWLPLLLACVSFFQPVYLGACAQPRLARDAGPFSHP